jgi:hypothetical protein
VETQSLGAHTSSASPARRQSFSQDDSSELELPPLPSPALSSLHALVMRMMEIAGMSAGQSRMVPPDKKNPSAVETTACERRMHLAVPRRVGARASVGPRDANAPAPTKYPVSA